jgi:hypothetical protein
MRTKLVGAFILSAVLAACGGGGGLSPREGCEESAVALCGRLYACYTPAELAAAGYPATEGACVTMFQTQQGCAAQTTENACQGNETYHADEADDCISQISGLDCAQVRDPNLNIDTAAPACARVCAVD